MAKDRGYGRSLFERLMELRKGNCYLLDVQYRMHPKISRFPSFTFYGGQLKDGPNVCQDKYERFYQELYGTYAFVDVTEGREDKNDGHRSKENLLEASAVLRLVGDLQSGTV